MKKDDLKNLDRITKVIMKPCPELVVKHVIRLRRKNLKNNKIYDFAFDYKFSDNTDGIRLETDDSIMFESTRYQENSRPDLPPLSAFISYMEAPFMIMCLDNAMTWLQGEHNKEIYISSPEGVPIKLGIPTRAVVPISNTKFISFQPTIIYDGDNLAYQGIKIKCDNGELANLTAQEFLQFALALKYVLMNLYSSSNTLTTLGLLYYLNT
jgi:hypothetical protein